MIERCIECGICKNSCPVYLAIKKESASPRTKGLLRNNKNLHKVFFLCTLCDAHKENCLLINLDLDIIDMRERLVFKEFSPEKDKEMIKNLKETGNIFGIKK